MSDGRPCRSRFAAQRASAIATACVLLGFGVAAGASQIEHYEGEAYAAGSGRLLYRESHWLYDDAGDGGRVVLYRCPDGTPFARKILRDTPSEQAPDFEMTDARDGYAEGVRNDGATREVYVRGGRQAVERSAALTTGKDTVVDAGFDAFVREHWSALDAAPVSLAFLVPSRLAALRFDVRKVGDETLAGQNAIRYRLSLASWYGGLLPHIDVVYAASTKRLLRYEGVSNVRGDNARNLDVRIDFPENQRNEGATATDVAAAVAAPLGSTCRL